MSEFKTLNANPYNRPLLCKECGGVMVFVGVGEYHCENCKAIDYDDYGKARNYLEHHPGATAAEVEMYTGVSQKAIRNLLKEDRLEITADSVAFLKCELCGRTIRSGRYCSKCLVESNRRIEQEQRLKHSSKISGHSKQNTAESGAKRFIH